MKILIVEDDKSLAALFRRILEPLHAETYTAYDWESAWDLIQAVCFDAICLDLGLPDSPTEITRKRIKTIKSKCPSTPIMVITGQAYISAEEVRADGADDFMHKTEVVCSTSLVERLSALIGRMNSSVKKATSQIILAQEATQRVIEKMKE